MDDVSTPGDWISTMEPDDHKQAKSTLGSATIHPINPQPTDGAPVHLQAAFDGSERSSGSSFAKDRLVFTVVEAAYLLNISRAFAYELVARGELPAIRLGRRIVIPRVGLEKLLGPSHC